MKEFKSYHTCIHVCLYFEFDCQEFSLACSNCTIVLGIHHVFHHFFLFDHDLEALNSIHYIHVMLSKFQVEFWTIDLLWSLDFAK